jgi:hypothetical protein
MPRSRRAYFRSQTVEIPVRIAHPPCSQWVTSSVFKGAFLAVRKRSLLHLGVHTLGVGLGGKDENGRRDGSDASVMEWGRRERGARK